MRKRLLISAAAMSAVFMMALPSFANTASSGYNYKFATGGSLYTDPRAKGWQSDAYMECLKCVDLNTGVSKYGSYNGVVYGGSSTTGVFSNLVTTDGKGSSTYSFAVGSKHYMSNYVYDCGMREAKIRGTMTGSNSYISISGNWQPDV